MYLSSQEALRLNESALKQFVSLGIPEGLYLDYKEQVSAPLGKEVKREFLKDVTAFANASGGHIVIGCKEPRDDLSVDEQMVGLPNATDLAGNLERLASTSIDPRISGLRVIPIAETNDRGFVVVHIPASMSRPHMVTHSGHRSFYIRNTESSFQMTTHEIREAVLTAASTEERARAFGRDQIREISESHGNTQPMLIIHAIPLINPEEKWDVLSSTFAEIVRGNKRRNKFRHYCNLASNNAPKPTINGIFGGDDRAEPTWETEIFKNGYVSAVLIKMQREQIDGKEIPVLHSGYCDFFRSFAHLLSESWDASSCDLPYLITAVHLNAEETALWTNSRYPQRLTKYGRNKIVWPEHLREPGTDPAGIAEELSIELFNAYGYQSVVE